MDEKILNSLLDYAREYMGAEIPFNNKWIIENFLIAERIKLSEQQSNCNLPHVSNNEAEASSDGVAVCGKKNCTEPVYEFGLCFKHYCISEEH